MRNESMSALDVLVGEWDLTLTDAWFLDSLETRVPGRASISCLDDAFVVWRWFAGDENEPAEFVIGRSDARDVFTALYHDHRGVCRVFAMTFDGRTWTLQREDPDFHQRIVAAVAPDRITARAEASEDAGRTWRKDFDLILERVGA